MEFEESIFNLIPKEAYVPPKQPKYKSKHDPKAQPTSTTFALNTTSKPMIANISGQVHEQGSAHVNTAAGATMGFVKGSLRPNANQFRLKNTGTFQLPEGKSLLFYQY